MISSVSYITFKCKFQIYSIDVEVYAINYNHYRLIYSYISYIIYIA